jgi:hypothetical protein
MERRAFCPSLTRNGLFILFSSSIVFSAHLTWPALYAHTPPGFGLQILIYGVIIWKIRQAYIKGYVMIKISPRQIKEKWTSGYALDVHTLSSEYIGHNEYGHPQFDTKYSDMGQLLTRLKYKSDKSVLGVIVDTSVEFLNSKN